jgi:hypothetical protein
MFCVRASACYLNKAQYLTKRGTLMKLVYSLFCCSTILVPLLAFADTSVTLSPGASVQIQAGQSATVTCSGTSVTTSCTCEVYANPEKTPNNWCYKVRKNGVVIHGGSCTWTTEESVGRLCLSVIDNEKLCR